MDANLKVLQWPNDALTVATKPIQKVTPELVETAKRLYDVMKAENGIGLAANQVGLDISLIVMEDEGKMLALFNPVILKRSKETEYKAEGCLSFKGVSRLIKRPVEATVKYRNLQNQMKYRIFKDLQARIVLHEYDHLQGIIFIDLECKND